MFNEFIVFNLAVGAVLIAILAVIGSVRALIALKNMRIPQLVTWAMIASGDTIQWENEWMQVVNIVSFGDAHGRMSVLLRQLENPGDFVHANTRLDAFVVKLVKP